MLNYKQLAAQYLSKQYDQEIIEIRPDPEQVFLLGNRYYDYGLAIIIAIVLPIIRYVLNRAVFEPLGLRLCFNTKKTDKKVDPVRLSKWNESFWKMTYYTCSTVIALAVTVNEIWFWDTRFFWLGCNHFPPCNLFVSKGVLFFYCLSSGWYIQSIHFLVFYETRRKDWLESMIHHVVTLALLVYSYYVNFTRIGCMIIMLHDLNDIFLEGAKMARYARRTTAATVLFAIFFVSWVVSRVVIFPGHVIRSTLTESLFYAKIHDVNPEPHYTIFNSLLLVLMVLHIYWTWLIFKVLAKAIINVEAANDVREDDDD